MEDIIKYLYSDGIMIDKHNNLKDIKLALNNYFNDSSISSHLFRQVLDIFCFDVLIGNIDRHLDNMGVVISNDGINMGRLFDNEKMLSTDSIYSGIYSIGNNISDYSVCCDYTKDNYLLNFFDDYPDYINLFLNKLNIIDEENIRDVFSRVEKQIDNKIPDYFKKDILNKFLINKKMIENHIPKIDDKKVLVK